MFQIFVAELKLLHFIRDIIVKVLKIGNITVKSEFTFGQSSGWLCPTKKQQGLTKDEFLKIVLGYNTSKVKYMSLVTFLTQHTEFNLFPSIMAGCIKVL